MKRNISRSARTIWRAPNDFCFFLGNSGKGRAKGCVVAIRGPKSLSDLQQVAAQTNKSGNFLTARYRIQSSPVFGTLLAAFVADMKRQLAQDGHLDGLFSLIPISRMICRQKKIDWE